MSEEGLTAALEKMRADGQPEEALRVFESGYRRLERGESALLPTAELEPAQEVPALEDLAPADAGDVLDRSGMLDQLLERGFHYAMISNSDNLGATLDPRIAALLSGEEIPFMMEVVVGTEAERKGGHIARRKSDGQLVLREIAQTPEADED